MAKKATKAAAARVSERGVKDTIASKIAARMDGWKNILTGLGRAEADRRESSEIEWSPMTESDADDLYAASDTARKIVDEIVEDSFREGYELAADEIDPDDLKAFEDENQRLQIDQKLQEAWKLSRMYGGAAIIPIPRDVNLLSKPYIPESIPEIKNLLVLSRWELPRQAIETDVRLPNFATPKSFRITPRTGADQMNFEVHHSWCLKFDGAYLPRIKFFQNNLWHDSFLNVCRGAIRDYDNALAAVSATLDDFSVGVMKIQGLTQMIADDRDDLVTKRLQIANLSRSVARTLVMDAENESYEYQNRQLSGVADCVRLVAGRLVVASGMPHTKILGESPEGSNATGNSTTKDWYDHVRSRQENYLDPRLITLWKWVLSAKKSPTGGKVPDGLKAVYVPLWQEPESVQATARKTQADADVAYINAGVLDAAEVAVSRFGSGEYSTATQLIDDREKQVKEIESGEREPGKGIDQGDPNDPNDPNAPAPKPGKKNQKPDDSEED